MSDNVLIIGAGGHGKVVADILRARGSTAVGFIDADESLWGRQVVDLPVLGGPLQLEKIARGVAAYRAVLAVGDNRVRLGLAREVEQAGLRLQRAIHPSATVSPLARLGQGVVICMEAAVGVEASIGDLAIVNTNATVDHECEIGRGAHICPGVSLAGRVSVGEGAFVGIGASVIQCRRIGDWATIGAGAVVIDDVPDRATAVGVPARELGARVEASAR